MIITISNLHSNPSSDVDIAKCVDSDDGRKVVSLEASNADGHAVYIIVYADELIRAVKCLSEDD